MKLRRSSLSLDESSIRRGWRPVEDGVVAHGEYVGTWGPQVVGVLSCRLMMSGTKSKLNPAVLYLSVPKSWKRRKVEFK